MVTETERVNVMLSRELHQALIESKPYEEDLQQWADYIVSEGLHRLEAQREADDE